MKYSKKYISELEEQIRHTEAINRWTMDALDMVASFDAPQAALKSANVEPVDIFTAARSHLMRLISFHAIAFFMVDELSSDFIISYCEPDSYTQTMEKEVDHQILEGVFAWALHRNRAVTVSAKHFDGTVMFHPLIAHTRILGMVVAFLISDEISVNNVLSNLITIVLSNTAKELENADLFQKMNETNRYLEHTVRKRTEDLQQALIAANTLNEAKSRFFANISHEIKTPLNVILGFTELIRDTTLSEEQKTYVDMIAKSGESLLVIINDILDFSKIEAGRFNLETKDFDPEEVLYDVCNLIQMKIANKPIDILCYIDETLPSVVRGDPGRFRQVLWNLMDNAAKFTERGEIEVSISAAEESAEGEIVVKTTVRDTGIGIPEEKQSIIFESFHQVDNQNTRKYSGTGLGLSICKQLSHLMGGDVWVESELGKGSIFHFKAQFKKSLTEKAPNQDFFIISGAKVLVVDGNQRRAKLLMKMLESAGVSLNFVNNTASALPELIRAQKCCEPYDICIIDISLLRKKAKSFVNSVRNQIQKIFLVIFGAPNGKYIPKSKSTLFNAFIKTPVRKRELLQAMAFAMKSSGSGDKWPFDVIERPSLLFSPLENKRITKILLAEDNPVNQNLVRIMLTKTGHTVELAKNGVEAVQKFCLSPSSFDLILMDIQMPEMDGIDAAKIIRSRGYSDIPIIALTASSMETDRTQCFKAGMNDYITKPVRISSLKKMVERWIE